MPDLAELRRIVEAHFRVYEAREQVHRAHVAARVFYVMVPPGEFDKRFEAVRAAMRQAYPDLLVFMRREGGEDILFVAERPAAPPRRLGLHLGLLIATIVTTVLAGAEYWVSYAYAGKAQDWAALFSAEALMRGAITFAIPLLLILGIHEMAHFVAARRHGLRPTLPYFIPAPPFIVPFGTFGAYISLRDPLPDRKALFDVGVSGPIAGFIVAVPILILGAMLTAHAAVPVPDLGRPEVGAEYPFTVTGAEAGRTTAGLATLRVESPPAGNMTFNVTAPQDDDNWSYTVQARIHAKDGTIVSDDLASRDLAAGREELRTVAIPPNATAVELLVQWDDHIVRFGDPLLVILLSPLFPDNHLYLTHPLFFAGWVGLLIAGINLLPVGQLDGGHVSRALLGDKAQWVARIIFAGLVALAFLVFDSWMFFALFVFALGLQHPPPLNDRTKLEGRRLVVAVLVILIFLVSFVPVPFQV